MAENTALKIFAQKLRNSKQFAANKSVDYINNNSTSKIIGDYNREQMLEGEDADRKDLGEYGAWRTTQRAEVGLQTDFIDLKFEGNFHESIYGEGKLLSAAKPAVVISTTSPEDWNAISEDERFKKALGLNQNNRDKVGMMIALEIQKELLKYYMP